MNRPEIEFDPPANEAERLGGILSRTPAIAFRWLALPGWPVDLVSPNVELWGYRPQQFLSGDLIYAELIHPEDLARVAAEVGLHSQSAAATFCQEYRLRDGSGRYRWVEDHTYIERDEAGQVCAYHGVLLDITARKRAEIGLELAAASVPALLDVRRGAAVVEDTLRQLGQTMEADRVYLFEIHSGREGSEVLASQRHEWCAAGVSAQSDNPDLQGVPLAEHFPRWYENLLQGRAVAGLVAEFPASERALLDPQGIQSLIVVPVFLQGRLWGFLGFDAVSAPRRWTAADERVLRLVAAALGAAVEHGRTIRDLRDGEQRLRLALKAAGAGAWEWRIGGHNSWSDEHYRILGLTPGSVAPGFETWLAAVHPADRETARQAVADAIEQRRPLDIEYRVVHPDGQVRWVYSLGQNLSAADGTVEGMTGILLDIHDRRQSEDRLRLSAAVMESTHDGVVITDLGPRIIAVNRAYCEITGYTESEVLGRNPNVIQSGRHDGDFYRQMWESIGRLGHWEGEIWSRRKDGEIFASWLTISAVKDEHGQPRNYVGVFADISRLKQTEEQLQRLAHYDPLTDLPNRLLVQSHLQKALERAEVQGTQVAVLFADLDRFKNVNDSLGHTVGDELLGAIGTRLRAALDARDTLARLGGDEFLIVRESLAGPADAAELARVLLQQLQAPVSLPVSGQEVFVTASVGISLYPQDGRQPSDLVRNADAAMYAAKEQGRNRFQFYAPGLLAAASEKLEMESRLRRALARQELVVHYQPVIRLADGALMGVEALVRWQTQDGVLIPPSRFIPLAEESGLIVPLGDFVTAQACATVQDWRQRGHPDLRLAVNVSARQLREADFVPALMRCLRSAGLPASALELEITETTLMGTGGPVIDTLHALRGLGVRLAVDDFGTGYSSLSYLKRLPLDTLKIDRSFVRDTPSHRGDTEIVGAIIAMGHHLQLDVLAEGVETEAQLAFLRGRGCDACQGNLIAPALPPEEWEARYLPKD